MGRVRKNLGLGYLIVAAIFLFNPNMVIIDILPDFIGYIFFLIGISQLADLNYYFENSARLFKKMLIVSIVQFLSVFILFGFVSPKEEGSTLMLFSFVFGTLELLFLIPAFKAFFDGLIYIGSRHESERIFFIPEKKQKKKILRLAEKKQIRKKCSQNITVKTMRFTIFFVVSKAVITFTPEAFAIMDTDSGFNFPFNIYDFVELFRTWALIILIPISFLWLFRFIKYVRFIIGDKPLINYLMSKFTEEISPKSFMFIQRYIKSAFIILIVGIAFNIDFYIDNSSILPDFISPLILILVFFIIKKFTKAPKKAFIFSILYFASSVSTYILNWVYYNNFTLSIKEIHAEAAQLFSLLTVSKIIDSVFFVLTMISILPIIKDIIVKNTGFAPIAASNFNAEDKIKYVHTMLTKRLKIVLILAILGGISSISYILIVSYFELMWLIEFVAMLCFVIYFGITLNAIQEEIEYKYILS